MQKVGDHAVVLGASMAGLLAARVLSDAYQRVTVVERDALPNKPGNRRGVPQGRHAHVLVPRGTQILDELFPGLLDDLVAGGAPVIRDLGELRFSPAGHRLCLKGRPPHPHRRHHKRGRQRSPHIRDGRGATAGVGQTRTTGAGRRQVWRAMKLRRAARTLGASSPNSTKLVPWPPPGTTSRRLSRALAARYISRACSR
jgi:hypothetical protein